MLNALFSGCVAPGRFDSRGFGGDMIFRQSRRLLTILAIASLAIAVANSQTTQSADYLRGYQIGQQAYMYGLPLVQMQWTFEVQTSIVPVNQFNPFRRFATPSDTTVVAPNFDTLYSIAWLDLCKEPVVISVPSSTWFGNRFFVIPLYDPYTVNFENLGSVNHTPEGDYAVVGPDHASMHLPKHVTRINSNYSRVWIIERIYANSDNATDINYVTELQNLITLTPLSMLGKEEKKKEKDNSKEKKNPKEKDEKCHPTGTINSANANAIIPTGMAFYDQLCQLLKYFPAPVADQPQLNVLAQIGIGPGRTPSTDNTLSADTVAGMIAAVAAGPLQVHNDALGLYQQTFSLHDGYLILAAGTYGTNYILRAIATQIGLGALSPDQAIYPIALLDRTGRPLTGTKNYTVHISANQFPPVAPPPAGFWSLTAYNIQGFLIPNPISRYNINDRSNLVYNIVDGSVDLYLQSTPPPTNQENWLPTPVGAPFELIWRLYVTDPSQIPGILSGTAGSWQPPPVLPVTSVG